jgi:hypothetical protein
VVDLVASETPVEMVASTVATALSGAAVIVVVDRAGSAGNIVARSIAATGDCFAVPRVLMLLLTGSDWIVFGRDGIAAAMLLSLGARTGDTDTTAAARDEALETLLVKSFAPLSTAGATVKGLVAACCTVVGVRLASTGGSDTIVGAAVVVVVVDVTRVGELGVAITTGVAGIAGDAPPRCCGRVGGAWSEPGVEMMRCGIRSNGLLARLDEFGDWDPAALASCSVVAMGSVVLGPCALDGEEDGEAAVLEEVVVGGTLVVAVPAVVVLATIVVTLLQVSLMAFSRARRSSASAASNSAMTRSNEPVR